MNPNPNDMDAWNVGNPQQPQGQGYPVNPQAGYNGHPQQGTGYPNAQPGYTGAQPGFHGGAPIGMQPGTPMMQPGVIPQGVQPGHHGPQLGYHGPQPGHHGPQPGHHGPQLGYHGPQPGYHGPQPGHQGVAPMGQHPGVPMMQSAMSPHGPQMAHPGGYQQGAPNGFHPSAPGVVQQGAPVVAHSGAPVSAEPGKSTDKPNGEKKHTHAPNPTLRPFANFKPDEDCIKLNKAMKGMGTDEKAIIEVLAHRTSEQRAKLVKQYKTMYGKDLIKELKSELQGNFEDVVEAMCYPLYELDARELREAMQGAGTDEDTLIEILATRSNAQLNRIKEIYSKLYPGRDLEKDLMSETNSQFRLILVSLVQANRDENPHVDMDAVRSDAQALLNAGEGRLGTDESTFNRILVSKSKPHIRAVIEEYGKIGKHDFEDALKKEMSGDLLRAFLAITRCIRNEPKYFAYELYKSMKGAGTNDRKLIRLVVTRSEIDMADIKREFQKVHGNSLESMIADDTSGDYKKMLLALVAG